eukprot:1111569-Rhodomonas_salina.1
MAFGSGDGNVGSSLLSRDDVNETAVAELRRLFESLDEEHGRTKGQLDSLNARVQEDALALQCNLIHLNLLLISKASPHVSVLPPCRLQPCGRSWARSQSASTELWSSRFENILREMISCSSSCIILRRKRRAADQRDSAGGVHICDVRASRLRRSKGMAQDVCSRI